jgi:DNA modification methylase
MVEVFREVRRVLKKEGTLWIVLGDTYASGKGTCYNPGGGKKSLCKERKQAGVVPLQRGNKSTLALSKLKPKDLVGIPWRVALALQQDGWWLRSDIIWHKTNVLPESVTDRPTKSHEYIFLLTKSPKYYYNNDAIREKTGNEHDPEAYEKLKDGDYYDKSRSLTTGRRWKSDIPSRHRRITHPLGRNKRTIWVTSCGNRTPGHYATYPEELITPCILAGCPPGGVVMDPFAGSGTTLVAAKRNGRQGIGYDLNPDYVKTATKRLNDVPVYKKMGEFT